MPDLAHLELDKDVITTPRAPRSLWRLVLTVVIICALGALAYYSVTRYLERRAAHVRVQTEDARPTRGASAPPPAETGENIALAPLDETDPFVREIVGRLSSHPKVVAWLAGDQLIRNFTVSVVNIAGGQSPARHLKRIAPSGAFRASQTGSIVYIDPASYRRYDAYADAVAAIDARGAARAYATLKPRIQDAARELGQRAEDDITTTLERAIAELLATPVVEGSVAVTSSSAMWTYADSRLESLSSAQRQLLRMGPRNVQIVQAKLREMAPYLGIPVEKLPPPTVVRFPDAR